MGILRGVADVEIYPYMDRQISPGELASAARRIDQLQPVDGHVHSSHVAHAGAPFLLPARVHSGNNLEQNQRVTVMAAPLPPGLTGPR